MELPHDFPHQPPEGYSYEVEHFRTNMVAIWLRHHYDYVYSDSSVRTIWGFWNSKKRQYIAPVNAKKPGQVVSIDDTRAYTSMPLKLNGLQYAFLHSQG